MHDRFYHHAVFEDKYGAEQVVVPLREMLECPEMGGVAKTRLTMINDVDQHVVVNVPFAHAQAGMPGNGDALVKALAEEFSHAISPAAA